MPRKGRTPEQILNKLRRVDVAVANGKSVGQAVKEIGVADHTRSASLRAGSTTAGAALAAAGKADPAAVFGVNREAAIAFAMPEAEGRPALAAR